MSDSSYQGDEGHIGWIIKGKVHCIPCALRSGPFDGARLYEGNVHPYSQSCHVCSKLIYRGADGWCELFDAPGEKQ